jgi:hypothetical protein
MMTSSDQGVSRRAVVPAILGFGLGVTLLTTSFLDDRTYDQKHRELFATIQVRQPSTTTRHAKLMLITRD